MITLSGHYLYGSQKSVFIGITIQLLIVWAISRLFFGPYAIFAFLGFLILINLYANYKKCIKGEDALTCTKLISYENEFDPEFMETHLNPTWTKTKRYFISNGLTLALCKVAHTCLPIVEYSQDGNYKVTITHTIGMRNVFCTEHHFTMVYERTR